MSKVIAEFNRPRYAIERWDTENAKWVFFKALDGEFQAKLQAEKACEKFDADTRVVDRGGK